MKHLRYLIIVLSIIVFLQGGKGMIYPDATLVVFSEGAAVVMVGGSGEYRVVGSHDMKDVRAIAFDPAM